MLRRWDSAITSKGGTMTVVAPNFVFVHVPKSAGRSITRVLGGETQGVPTHTPYTKLANFGIDKRFSFGFVRNPWDRMVSLYSFLCQKRLQAYECPDYQQYIRDIGFKAWLLEDEYYSRHDEHWPDEALPPLQRRSQLFWLSGCDFIGKIENINSDFRHIRKRIGLKPTLMERLRLTSPVPKKNSSKRGNYTRYFDEETRAFVEAHFQEEIRVFNYTFGS
ncbi:hypothetical protein BBK91_019260 [Agrobacterium vitis]|uniref:Sulfotransferase family protein n=3 Tax=Rhizobiaceae TaxID=82115 RepID=B9JZ02_ALLAM|nr:hypothetical protein Avi_3135 [Allorhizobium ampelinum S4]MUO30242.1 hypothetical protein [Agrobacterium vitis]MUO45107.1 hypothetical protein [Agrobacterium vitis]MUP12003.1 hypothetical protein [Agrobacterium vitis]